MKEIIPILVKEGFTGQEIKASIFNQLKNKFIESDIRDLGHLRTSGQRNAAILMQQLGESQ